MRCLGFCVSIQHASSWAQHFNRHGIDAVAIWGDSPRMDREAALRDLAEGRVRSGVFRRPCSTRVSTCPRWTPSSCCGRPRVRRCSSSSSAEGCARHPERRSARSSTLSAPIERNSGSTGATGRCSAAPACSTSSGSRSHQRFPCSSQLAATWTLTKRPRDRAAEACATQYAVPMDGEGRRA